ncbi:MAG: hypothetical protein HXY28_09950 [Hydrogenophilaceae bacterium]|nr:hypothetical protein [Hydrogenophilaceae bacterium]
MRLLDYRPGRGVRKLRKLRDGMPVGEVHNRASLVANVKTARCRIERLSDSICRSTAFAVSLRVSSRRRACELPYA